nr:hypothetical protein [Erysipelothrix rhusiopathiae]
MSYREEEQFTSEKLDVGLWKKILKMLLENKKNLFLALVFCFVGSGYWSHPTGSKSLRH